ncbi:MAG TPA: hypothetical protein DEQ61_09460 [Streptomyces sp.]|nr:hypothetical protein [Streptomyces sp.]
MQAHAIGGRPTAHARPEGGHGMRLPAAICALYGVYAGFLDSDSGASTTRAALLGLITGAVLLALWSLVRKVRPRMMLEARSMLQGALAGSAFGLLVSLSGASVLKAAAIGLAAGAAVALTTHYRLYGKVR